MTEPGEVRPGVRDATPPTRDTRDRLPASGQVGEGRPGVPRRSRAGALLLALGAALLVAAAWALLRGILELGAGLLALAAVGGWAIGAALRTGWPSAILAALMGAAAWLLGLVLTWLVAMALLPASSRTLPERIAATPFIDWLSPQFELLEVVGLLLLAGVAGVAARR